MIPWSRNWQPTPVLLPGEFHGQRSLAGYSSWDLKESDTTEQLTLTFFFFLTESHTLPSIKQLLSKRVDKGRDRSGRRVDAT